MSPPLLRCFPLWGGGFSFTPFRAQCDIPYRGEHTVDGGEPGPNGEDAELIRSYALARQRRDDLLARFAAPHAGFDRIVSPAR